MLARHPVRDLRSTLPGSISGRDRPLKDPEAQSNILLHHIMPLAGSVTWHRPSFGATSCAKLASLAGSMDATSSRLLGDDGKSFRFGPFFRFIWSRA